MEHHPRIGVIGGSGLYQMDNLENIEVHEVSTPYGNPSSPIIIGDLKGKRVAFLARHGIGHVIAPTQVNYRANIYALKSLGVKYIISVSAVGSLREDYAPGDLVVPDQLFDFTKDRKRTFFDKDLVAHVDVAEPFCPNLSKIAFNAINRTKANVHRGGSLITIEGPRFSTKSESNTFRIWGMSIIGMTTSPEAFLAREAEMCYTVMAHVSDYDVWHISKEPVTVEQVIKVLNQNVHVAQEAVKNLIADIDDHAYCEHQASLKTALISSLGAVSKETLDELAIFVKKYF